MDANALPFYGNPLAVLGLNMDDLDAPRSLIRVRDELDDSIPPAIPFDDVPGLEISGDRLLIGQDIPVLFDGGEIRSAQLLAIEVSDFLVPGDIMAPPVGLGSFAGPDGVGRELIELMGRSVVGGLFHDLAGRLLAPLDDLDAVSVKEGLWIDPGAFREDVEPLEHHR